MKYIWICALVFRVTSASMETIHHSDLKTVAKAYLEESENTSLCRIDLLHLAISAKEPWALEMLDSFGKPGSGLISGNIRWTGNRNHCSKIRSVGNLTSNKQHGQRVFSGKYCWLHWKPLILANYSSVGSSEVFSFPLQSGACIPDTCSAQDILETYPLFVTFLDRYETLKGVFSKDIILSQVECLNEIPRSFNIAMNITCFLLVLLLFLTVVSTALIYIFAIKAKTNSSKEQIFHDNQKLESRKQRCPMKISSCFSASHNFASLINMDQKRNELEFLNGIRVLSFIWVVIGHGQLQIIPLERIAKYHATDTVTPGYQFLHHGFYAVDTFLFMGAFLSTFILIKNFNIRLNLKTSLYIILKRYLRLGPLLLLVFPFINYPAKFLDKNPSGWRLGDPWKACSNTWWTHAFLLNNLLVLNPNCHTTLWYLAVDFQMFVISIPILITIKRSRVQGKIAILSAILSTLLMSVYIVYSNNIGTFYDYLVICSTQVKKFIMKMGMTSRQYNSLPYTRGFSYLCGILYALNAFKKKTTRKPAFHYCVTQLILSLAAFLFVILGPVYIKRSDLENAVFLPLMKVSWVFGVVAIFNICLKSPNFFVSRFLSWRGWKPFAKLTFSSYLLHIIIMDSVLYNNEQFYTYSRKNLNTMTLGILITSYAAAFVFSIIAEAPIIKMGKLLMSKY